MAEETPNLPENEMTDEETAGKQWENLVDPFKLAIMEGLRNIVEGAASDVETFAVDIARNMSRVVVIADAERRGKLLRSLLNQTEMLAEINRIRVVNATFDTVQRVILVATEFALQALDRGVIKI